MTREEYRKKLSRIIGDESSVIELMIDLDNVIKHDLPPAEGAEQLTKEQFTAIIEDSVKDVWYGRRSMNPVKEQTELLVEKLYPLMNKPQPTAEGAEEMDVYKSAVDFVKKAFTDLTHDEWQKLIEVVMKHTTLHAQKIADKMVEEKVKEAVEQEKSDIRQWLLDEGYEILSEKI